MTDEHLHPESMRQLRQLVKLHGAPALRKAIEQIEMRQRIENAKIAAALSAGPADDR